MQRFLIIERNNDVFNFTNLYNFFQTFVPEVQNYTIHKQLDYDNSQKSRTNLLTCLIICTKPNRYKSIFS